jgi:putative nucleotidyltransferase with HDIG domain
MVGAIDAKDSFTAGHSERVASLAGELASKMGLSPKEIEEVHIAGILHDVGKIAIPDVILNKSERLTDDEMFVMRSHPLVGAVLMEPISLPEEIMRGILEHHERPDGKGYPNGTSGEDRSLTGQILKVADVFDALTSRRQYKEPWTAQKAYEVLLAGRGTEFDEVIVDALTKSPFKEH